jgi:hypothetical protein
MLSRLDNDFDYSVRTANVAVINVILRVPVSNASLYFTDKIKATVLGQVAEIAD